MVQSCSRILGHGSVATSKLITRDFEQNDARSISVRCAFSIQPCRSGPDSVNWEGPLASFHKLNENWDRISNLIATNQFRGVDDIGYMKPSDPIFVQLDAVAEISYLPAVYDPILVLQNLVQVFEPDELQVLLLGIAWSMTAHPNDPRFENIMSGLILIKGHNQWVRIGVCQWSHRFDWTTEHMSQVMTQEDKDFLRGHGRQWVQQKGILGYVDWERSSAQSATSISVPVHPAGCGATYTSDLYAHQR